jgi:hypothetical protein
MFNRRLLGKHRSIRVLSLSLFLLDHDFAADLAVARNEHAIAIS